jgi:hypothetical protein
MSESTNSCHPPGGRLIATATMTGLALQEETEEFLLCFLRYLVLNTPSERMPSVTSVLSESNVLENIPALQRWVGAPGIRSPVRDGRMFLSSLRDFDLC